jgi:nicotinamide-nucleotide amidase
MYTKNEVGPIADILLKARHTVAVAESVTSGHLQAALSLADFAQDFYQGGITVYNIGQKCRHLGVEPIHAQAHNAVSKQVAEQMTYGVTKAFSSHWGVGICGYAAPVPELDVKVPYAFFAIAHLGAIKISRRVVTEARSGRPTQEYYVSKVLRDFESLLKGVRAK